MKITNRLDININTPPMQWDQEIISTDPKVKITVSILSPFSENMALYKIRTQY